MAKPSVVALGGGTGLPAVLRAVRRYAGSVTAVVTVADNGGSSGRLRRDLGILPPGDIRNCLVALADEGSPLVDVFRYRFQNGGGIAGHNVGNLIIAALSDVHEDFVGAIDAAGRMLGVCGRVLPSTISDVSLSALTKAGGRISGQIRVARTKKPIVRVSLDPPSPEAYPETVEAILEADQIVMGPGSLFTSIIPNLLVPEIRQAIRDSKARRIFVMNIMTQPGETSLCSAVDHIAALQAHCGERVVDVVLANVADGEPVGLVPIDGKSHLIRPCSAELEAMGYEVVVADLMKTPHSGAHNVDKLSAELEKLL